MTEPEILEALKFNKNLVWDAVMTVLSIQIEGNNLVAVSRDCKGEDRAHACGVVDGLISFRAELERLNKLAQSK